MRNLCIKTLSTLFVIGLGLTAFAATPTVTSVTAQQRYPWNGLVDIVVTISGAASDVANADCMFAATDSATKQSLTIAHVTQVGEDSGSGSTWTRRFLWDTNADVGEVKIANVELVVEVGISNLGGVQLWENGPYWAECNVGATKPEECGYYFGWGDTVGYGRVGGNWERSDGRPTGDTYYIFRSGNCYDEHCDAATTHLGMPWRMPTHDEFTALIANCDAEWATRNGTAGRLVKGRGNYSSKSIFLPAAGIGQESELGDLGVMGWYWSSSEYVGNSDFAWLLEFTSDRFFENALYRRWGMTVRPLYVASWRQSYSTLLALDNRTGVRVADATERIRFSPAWESDSAGAMATVCTNGVAVKTATEAGTFDWTPSQDGIYEFAHAVTVNGVPVGETLSATFVVGMSLKPRGCDWTTGTIELGWQGGATNLNAITYSVYWSESDDPASCVNKDDHLVGTKTFSPTEIGVQELTISDDQYLTHGDGLNPIYYHVIGSDGSKSCCKTRNRHGLFVGIDKYADTALKELDGCVDDAQKWCSMFTSALESSNTKVMENFDCTKEAVLRSLEDFASDVRIGDVFVYVHSSHGNSYILCCYDSGDEGEGDISAAEFAEALKLFRKGAGVVVVLDTCRSGTIPSSMAAPRLLKQFLSSSSQSAPTSTSFAESVITEMSQSSRLSVRLMSTGTTSLPIEERIMSGSEIGWLTAVNDDEDSLDGVFSSDCLLRSGWEYGGADKSHIGNDDGSVDFGELGRFAKYWCGRMYDQYKMTPQVFSADILNNIRAGNVTSRYWYPLLSKPQNVTATVDRNDGIEVTWDPVDRTVGYWVCFLAGDGELHYKVATGTSCLIQPTNKYNLAFGQPVQIYVKAWNLMDVSELSETVTGIRAAHYTLKFDANGGVGEMPDADFVVGVEQNLPRNLFHRECYTFGGWGLAANSVASAYKDGEAVTDICTLDGEEDTLYAFWVPNVVKLTFHYGPFADKFGPREFAYTVGTVFHDFPFVSSTAWHIKGWFTQLSGGVQYEPGDVLPFTTDGTLYLQAVYQGGNPPSVDDPDDPWTNAVTIVTTALPAGVENVPYEFALEAKGGTKPYTWQAMSLEYQAKRSDNSFDEGGVAQGWKADDKVWEYELPFDFSFYGQKYRKVFVCSNGYLTFGNAYSATSGSLYSLKQNRMICGCWKDLWTNRKDGEDVSIAVHDNSVVFRWCASSWSSDDEYNFAITLKRDGGIVLSYGEGNSECGVVGISAGDGSRYVMPINARVSLAQVQDIEFEPGLVCSNVDWPEGISLSPNGVVSGVSKHVVTNEISVSVQDANGCTTNKTFSFVVEANPNLRPVIDAVEPNVEVAFIPEGEAGDFSVVAHDPEGAEVTYAWYVDGELVENASGATFAYQPEDDEEEIGYRRYHVVECFVSDGFWEDEVSHSWDVKATRSYYVDCTAEEGGSGTSLEDAFTSIEEALRLAQEKDTIYVAPGVYEPFGFYGHGGLTIKSLDGADKTIIDCQGDGGLYGHYEWHPEYDDDYIAKQDLVEGFTVRNGRFAVHSLRARRCVFSDCFAGVASGCQLEDCVITGNETAYQLVDKCKLIGCTIAGNVTECAVERDSRVFNSIVRFNYDSDGNESNYSQDFDSFWDGEKEVEVARVQFYHSCTWPMPYGSENIDEDPLLVDVTGGDVRLRKGSPCVDAASVSYVQTDFDVAGAARVQGDAPDMGAVEGSCVDGFVISTRICGVGAVTPSTAVVSAGESVEFVADTSKRPFIRFETNGVFATDSARFLWENIREDGVLTAVYGSYTHYVDAASGNDDNDGLSWGTSKRTLQDAINNAVDGEMILVKSGTYGPITSFNKRLRIENVDASFSAIIDGGGVARCATLSDSSAGTNTCLIGFTLRNGRSERGGGSYGGTLVNCAVVGNVATSCGGGMYYGVANGCLICSNEANSVSWYADGGGLYSAKAYNCEIRGNKVLCDGGQSSGGGCYSGSAYNCLILDNVADGVEYAHGGGSCSTTVCGCTVVGNVVASESADNALGAGTYGGSVYNSIVWANRDSGNVLKNYSGSMYYSCSMPLPSGISNICANPLFVDLESGDYRLSDGSPCIDVGNKYYVMGERDFYGDPRLVGDKPDMGASEWMETAMTPVIVPADGTVFDGNAQKVKITCATLDAEIHYTLDGSDPTRESPRYAKAFNVRETTTVKARAYVDLMRASDVATSVITKYMGVANADLAEALDVPTWDVFTDGDNPWVVVTDETCDGEDAARSAQIGDNQTIWMQTSVTGRGTLTFWWKASCEDDVDYDDWDHVRFVADGLEKARLDGITDWIQVSVAFDTDGVHVLRWEYVKDEIDSDGEDCAWVDDVVWTPASAGDVLPELPENASAADVKAVLDGAADPALATNIVEVAEYERMRTWASGLETDKGTTAAAREAFNSSKTAWLSYAFDSRDDSGNVRLIDGNANDARDVKIDEFVSVGMAGLFGFTVSIEDVSVGERATAGNLAKVLRIEGGQSLKDMSTDKVDVTFGTPVNGKVKLTAGPKDATQPTFFMKVKMTP